MLEAKPKANPVLGVHEDTATARAERWLILLPAIGEEGWGCGCIAGCFPLAAPVLFCL